MDDVGIGMDDMPEELATESRDLGDDLDRGGAPLGFRDWRDSVELPRQPLPDYPQGFYTRRKLPISVLTVHHTASNTDDIFFDNNYHQKKNWNPNPQGAVVRAPHIAYHFFIDRGGQLTACNYLWERSWHATNANDRAVGIVCQGDFQSGNNRPTDAQLQTLQWILDKLMDSLKLDRGAVWGHGELRRDGNSTTCPGKNFLPDVQRFRDGKDFWASTVGGDGGGTTASLIRWKVVDPNGTQLGLFNVTANAVAAAEQTNGIGIYQSSGEIRIDFRGAQNANPDAPAKWRVVGSDDTHLGLYNQTPNAVEHAERIGGYARYLYDNAEGNTRVDLRNLG
jgi:hypothetical protein